MIADHRPRYVSEAYPNGSIPQVNHMPLWALKPDASRPCIKTMRICLLMHSHLSHFQSIASSDVESVVTFSSDSNEDNDDLNKDDDDDLDDDASISLSEDDNLDEDGDTSDSDDEDKEDTMETGRIN